MSIHRSLLWLIAVCAAIAAIWVLRPSLLPPAAPSAKVAPRPETLAVSESPDVRWQRAAAAPATFARDVELAAALEEIASADPEAAGKLLLALPEADRRRTVAAVLLDAADRPQAASQLAAAFCRLDPEAARDHGYAVIKAFARTGGIDAALEFVAARAADTADSENPQKWLKATYAAWAETQPAAAVAHAAALPDDGAREEALAAALGRWAAAQPAAALAFGLQLPPSSARETALGRVARSWAENDPAAAAGWLAAMPPSAEFDRAAETLANTPQLDASNAATAFRWAERIVSPTLRARALATVVLELAASAPHVAVDYLKTSRVLSAEERAQLLARVAP